MFQVRFYKYSNQLKLKDYSRKEGKNATMVINELVQEYINKREKEIMKEEKELKKLQN